MAAPAKFRWFLPLDVDVTHIGTWPPVGPAPTVERLAAIVSAAEAAGFTGLLVPTSYHNMLDTVTTAGAVLSRTGRASLLLAMRPNQYHPAQAAMMVASLAALFPGRVELNIVTGGWPEDRWIGNDDTREQRSERLAEWLDVFEAVLYGGRPVAYTGEYYWSGGARLRTPPARRVPLAMSGSSPKSREQLRRHGDEYLMFAAPPEQVRQEIEQLRATPGCEQVPVSVRAHVVVAETEDEARAAAAELTSRVDPRVSRAAGARVNDPASQRARQDALAAAEDLWVAPNLWAGIGGVRHGVAVALVGSPEQIADRLAEYVELGAGGFILSGYPKLEQCRRFGELLTPVLRRRGLMSPDGAHELGEPVAPRLEQPVD